VSGKQALYILAGTKVNLHRLVLYYPVSSLVTLFANILQNPQDSRARSDLKLMTHVVQFLSALSIDASNGAVKRMLNICSEFERISKVVLDKSDRESSSRRKRKPAPDTNGDTKQTSPPVFTPQIQVANPAVGRANVFTPPGTGVFMGEGGYVNGASPGSSVGGVDHLQFLSAGSTPMATSPLSRIATPATANSARVPFQFPISGENSISPELSAALGTSPSGLPPAASLGSMSDIQSAYSQSAPPLSLAGNAFQQPFVPQDLWQMPMTLEWDWADLTQGLAGGGDAGASGLGGLEVNGVLNNIPAARGMSPMRGMSPVTGMSPGGGPGM
jgi:hypothetical protein